VGSEERYGMAGLSVPGEFTLEKQSWDAWMAGEMWVGKDKIPLPNQRIQVAPCTPFTIEKQEKQRSKEEAAWERTRKGSWSSPANKVTDSPERSKNESAIPFGPYHTLDFWPDPVVPTEQSTERPLANEEDYSILVKYPELEDVRIVRIPRDKG
jgi:hypothetical protein